MAQQPAADLEDDRIEFKQEDTDPRRTLEILTDAVVCLANAEGGVLVVGVTDRPDPGGSITGVSPALTIDVVVRGIFARTRPALSVPIQEIDDGGHRLLLITVPRGASPRISRCCTP